MSLRSAEAVPVSIVDRWWRQVRIGKFGWVWVEGVGFQFEWMFLFLVGQYLRYVFFWGLLLFVAGWE